jgi:hypothetical protein
MAVGFWAALLAFVCSYWARQGGASRGLRFLVWYGTVYGARAVRRRRMLGHLLLLQN